VKWKGFLPSPPYEYEHLVYPDGPLDAKIVIVGEAPGEDELLQGRPFVGAAGQLLGFALREAGINRSNCFVTNVSLERPTANKFKSYFYDRLEKPVRYVPTPRLQAWRKCLEAQIEEIDPNVIIALGNEPLAALTGYDAITKRRGSIYKSHTGHKVVPAVHPAAVMRQYRMNTLLIHDLQRANENSYFPHIIDPADTYEIHIEPDIHSVVDFLTHVIENKPPVVIDLETRGQSIACVGIADRPDRAMVIPLMRTQGHYWKLSNEAVVVALLCKILRDPKIPKIGQNFLSFDCAVIKKEWNTTVRGVEMDTMHAHHVVYMERFGPNCGHSLGFLTSVYTQPVMNYYKDEGKVWEKNVGEQQFWTYCGKDCIATYQARNGIQAELDEEQLASFYTGYVNPLAKVCQKIQFRGLYVDTVKRDALLASNEDDITRIQRIINSVVGTVTNGAMDSLNVNSNPQMKKFFYEEMKLPKQYKKSKGKKTLTVDEDGLVKLKSIEPRLTLLVDFILRMREIKKEQGFLNTNLSDDNRLHTILSVSGTETGRLSSRADLWKIGTNLQNVKNELRCIVKGDPGYQLWEADSSQAEARVVAVLAQQWDLVDLFERGDIDVHWENAKRIFGLKRSLAYREANSEHYRMRYLAKRVIHASNYGMSWFRLRQLLLTDAGISMAKAEVEELLERYHSIYPNIRGIFQSSVEAKLRADRTLVTPFGRRRVFYDRWGPELLRAAYAYIPQSTVVDLVNKALLDFDEWCETTHERVVPLMQVHDSIVYQTKPAMAFQARKVLKDLMERSIVFADGYELSIPADFARGQNWAKYHKSKNPEGMREAA
jgi:uracil-DNA glycosylase family 4